MLCLHMHLFENKPLIPDFFVTFPLIYLPLLIIPGIGERGIYYMTPSEQDSPTDYQASVCGFETQIRFGYTWS